MGKIKDNEIGKQCKNSTLNLSTLTNYENIEEIISSWFSKVHKKYKKD